MMFSPIKTIGSLVYRTREALNNDPDFIAGLSDYPYSANCYVDGEFNMWHYPGTHNEIANVLVEIGKAPNGSRVKFPCVFDFQTTRQTRTNNIITVHYNLAFVSPVLTEWTTETREVKVFDTVLRPMYKEFMKQINKSGYFKPGYGYPRHDYYEVFTTGKNDGELIKRYGDHIDAIELHNLILEVGNLCDRDLTRIEEEDKAVTSNYEQLLKL